MTYKLQWIEADPHKLGDGDTYYLAPVNGVGCFRISEGGYGDRLLQFRPFVNAEDHVYQANQYFDVNVRPLGSGPINLVDAVRAA